MPTYEQPPADEPSESTLSLLTLVGGSDVLLGVVLLGIGLTKDIGALVVTGAILFCLGLAVSGWAILRRDRPARL
ncbi:MAG: hypothetical protein F2667_06405 [Actinobacteria bacterium]|nr:hypothetical protein [Actinomycetota bacterium]